MHKQRLYCRHLKTSQRCAGFSLIEVLIALVILAIALTGVIIAMGSGVRLASKVRDSQAAYWVATNEAAGLELQLFKLGGDDSKGDTRLVTMMKQHWVVKIKPAKQGEFINWVTINVYKSGANDQPEGPVEATLHSSYLHARQQSMASSS